MRDMRIALAGVLALATTVAAEAQRARSTAPTGLREPTEAQMKDAVLSVTNFRLQRMGMSVTITYFEKQGCEKAQGRIGYNCDFLVRYGGNGMVDLANAFIGEGSANQASGRFYLRSGNWDFIADKPDKN